MPLYSSELIETMRAAQFTLEVSGTSLVIKPSPDEFRPGYIDPRELQLMNQSPPRPPDKTVQEIRDGMGFPNRNMNTVEIHTVCEELLLGENRINLWRYFPRKPERKTGRKALLYIHGGGWVGGSVYTVENPCKLLAERADCVVFNIDYSLAPEKPYPNGFNDCWNAICHIYENAEKYGIDPNKIAVAGDSAGGNLAAACSTKDRDLGKNLIQYQALIYPCVTLVPLETPGCEWSLDDFEVVEEYKARLTPGLIGMSGTGPRSALDVKDLYSVDRTNEYHPNISPMLSNTFEGLPRTTIVTAEFDGLRTQGECYGRELHRAGVNVRTIRYKAVFHAFLDKLGFLPQAEDLIDEIVQDLSEM